MLLWLLLFGRGSLRLSEAIAAGTDKGVREVRGLQDDVDPHDIVEIQFTSVSIRVGYGNVLSFPIQCHSTRSFNRFFQGTTGSPKAAMLTHHNVVNNAHMHNLRRYTTGSPKVQ